jgi:hypothetical protein
MLVTVELVDAGVKTGKHRVLVIGGCSDMAAPGDIGMSLEEAKTLLSALQWEFVAAQGAEITECAVDVSDAAPGYTSKTGHDEVFIRSSVESFCRVLVLYRARVGARRRGGLYPNVQKATLYLWISHFAPTAIGWVKTEGRSRVVAAQSSRAKLPCSANLNRDIRGRRSFQRTEPRAVAGRAS